MWIRAHRGHTAALLWGCISPTCLRLTAAHPGCNAFCAKVPFSFWHWNGSLVVKQLRVFAYDRALKPHDRVAPPRSRGNAILVLRCHSSTLHQGQSTLSYQRHWLHRKLMVKFADCVTDYGVLPPLSLVLCTGSGSSMCTQE